MKKVLIAAYYYPPFSGVGGLRVAKFVKYLPECRWEPRVFTVDDNYYRQKARDDSHVNINISNVHRFRYIKILDTLKLIKLVFPFALIWHIFKNRNQTDVVMLCGSPFHPFMVTPLVHLLFKLPVILDFRDGWSIHRQADNPDILDSMINIIRSAIEIVGIKFSSAVIFATSGLRDLYISKYSLQLDQCHSIFNGFDPDDLLNITPVKLTNDKSLYIAGKFNFYTPDVVHHVLNYLKKEPGIILIYLGNEKSQLEKMAESRGVLHRTILLDYQPYKEALRIAAGSDICLVTTNYTEALGTKIFEYLALKKQILCFVPRGSEITATFGQLKNIIISETPHEYTSVKDAIDKSLCQEVSVEVAMEQFSRKRSAQLLSNILDKCAHAA